MAYTSFSLDDLKNDFGLNNQVVALFANITKVAPSQKLIEELEEADELPKRSEKSKSEWIVAPILKELRRRNNKFFTIYSGENLNADDEKGLNGECDFILTKDTKSFNISYPIIQIVEAKKNDIEIGVPQCAAQMIGAKVFNENKGIKLEKIYGCVTTGKEWLFMKLEDKIYIDKKSYNLENIEELLGVFQFIIDYYKKVI